MSMGEWKQAPDGKTRWWDGQAWGAELKASGAQAQQQVQRPAAAKGQAATSGVIAGLSLVKGIAGLVAIGLVIWVVVSCSTWSSKDGASGTINIVSARSVCETATKQQLKAPDTAKFTWDKQDLTSDTTASLSGHVSSQNGFGALIATGVTCEATYDLASDEVRARAKLAE